MTDRKPRQEPRCLNCQGPLDSPRAELCLSCRKECQQRYEEIRPSARNTRNSDSLDAISKRFERDAAKKARVAESDYHRERKRVFRISPVAKPRFL